MSLFLIGVIWLGLIWWQWRRSQQGHPVWLHHADLCAGGVLFLLVLGFFWRTLSGEVYQPADGGDLVSFLFPTYRFAAQTLRQGVLPLWNPHLYGGAPFISDIQAGFLYLPNLLLFLLWPQFDYRALQWSAVGHLYWAALGTYVLLRTLRWPPGVPVSRPAAIFGALAFALSDPLLIHFGNLNLIAVLSWLPWTLAAYHHALTELRWRWAALAALLFALGNYAGHAQSSLYVGLALGIYTLLGWFAAQRAQLRDWRAGIQSLVSSLQSLLLVFGLTVLLSAPILLPALELTRYTDRSTFTYQDTVNFSLAPTQALLGLVTPGFFGHGPALHWSLWQRVETPFAGVATLILALAACLLARAETRQKLWPWVGLALVGLLTALGVYAILHGWLTLLLPGFDQLRAPARALVLWTLGVSVVAAVGLDQLSQSPVNGRTALSNLLAQLLRAGTGILVLLTALAYFALLLTQQDPTAFLRASLAALALSIALGCWVVTWGLIAARQANWLRPTTFAVLMIALLYFDLSAAAAYTDISPTDPTAGYQNQEIVDFLRADPELFRIDSNTEIAALWQPDAAALHGLQDIYGIANPLTLRRWTELLEATGGRHTRLYDLLNVKYLLVRDGTPLPEDKFELAFDAPNELAVYRNRTVMPRAWLAHTAIAQADEAQTLQSLRDPAFDPSVAVVLALPADQLGAVAAATGSEMVTLQAASPNALTIQVQATAPAYLVLSEVWYPGWQATVNGEASEVLRADHALRAVYVPAGESVVQLWFAPRPWRWGFIAGGVGLVLLVGLWVIDRKRAGE